MFITSAVRDTSVNSRPKISIVVPTQRRPGPLALAVRSLFAQVGISAYRLELVVADNDLLPSAKSMVDDLRLEAPFPIIYVHEPQPGVANVRNAAMRQARGDLIAFLDDDEEAPPGWLIALLECQKRFDADVVFGPVLGRVPPSIVKHRAYFEQFFSRLSSAKAGPINRYYGCGNSLLRRRALPDPLEPFSAERNQIGGEDDLLFATMSAASARFAWEPAAWVWEDPGPERLDLRYTLRRAFAYGHGPIVQCGAHSPPDHLGIARWVIIGLAQTLVYGLAALVLWEMQAPNRAFMLDRVARGLGKVLWGGPFTLRFYGR